MDNKELNDLLIKKYPKFYKSSKIRQLLFDSDRIDAEKWLDELYASSPIAKQLIPLKNDIDQMNSITNLDYKIFLIKNVNLFCFTIPGADQKLIRKLNNGRDMTMEDSLECDTNIKMMNLQYNKFINQRHEFLYNNNTAPIIFIIVSDSFLSLLPAFEERMAIYFHETGHSFINGYMNSQLVKPMYVKLEELKKRMGEILDWEVDSAGNNIFKRQPTIFQKLTLFYLRLSYMIVYMKLIKFHYKIEYNADSLIKRANMTREGLHSNLKILNGFQAATDKIDNTINSLNYFKQDFDLLNSFMQSTKPFSNKPPSTHPSIINRIYHLLTEFASNNEYDTTMLIDTIKDLDKFFVRKYENELFKIFYDFQ